ncbi:MAG TPA: farnesyl diphosphate synthase [Pseudomonadales bacterium]|nr:farnesyl diphosphate synthase [Pseudomonadales bacterium]
MSSTFPLAEFISRCQQRVNESLNQWLSQPSLSPKLSSAMHYATMQGGKRFRPVLVYATCQALGADLSRADNAASAVELLHSYSLVHDDLPAMDDDELRRGQPTCHIAFDEATAILAGDALQSLAFEVLAADTPYGLSATIRLDMIATLAKASGTIGMAAGQALDLEAEGQSIGLESLETIHRHKTGTLIRACVRMGALAAGCTDAVLLAKLDAYADHMGHAFQVHDDILDVIGDTTLLGKKQGADEALDKMTYPKLLGLEASKAKAQELHDLAMQAIAQLGPEADVLRALSEYVITRSH